MPGVIISTKMMKNLSKKWRYFSVFLQWIPDMTTFLAIKTLLTFCFIYNDGLAVTIHFKWNDDFSVSSLYVGSTEAQKVLWPIKQAS